MLTWCRFRVLSNTCSVCEVLVKCRSASGSTANPVAGTKRRKETDKDRRFVDFRHVRVVGGNGGDGCVSFLRLPKKEFAGPDGGDGGNGGHVVFKAVTNKRDLSSIPSVIAAPHGANGQNKHCHGKNAESLYIEVPLGTRIKDESRKLLASLDKAGDYFIGARGGAGGKGNNFYLSNEERAPNVAETGGQGEQAVLGLELKTIAHVGLIGFPNAGKSTLLRAISRARPKVAEYPFTTLHPHVGMVLYDDHEQLAVADIPGLITGAHQNRGLGFEFLRHIQRCLCLIYVIDLSVEKCWTQLDDLQYELEQYEPGLSTRPHAIVANKMDVKRAPKNLEDLKAHVDLPIFAISAKYEKNLKPLLLHMRELYDSQMSEQLRHAATREE